LTSKLCKALVENSTSLNTKDLKMKRCVKKSVFTVLLLSSKKLEKDWIVRRSIQKTGKKQFAKNDEILAVQTKGNV
jgi:hypothetical protein